MAFWGAEVTAKNPIAYPRTKTGKIVRITQATLGLGGSMKKSVLLCTVGSTDPGFLCALFPGHLETLNFRLEFGVADDVVFSVKGPRSIYLIGYYIRTSHPYDLNNITSPLLLLMNGLQMQKLAASQSHEDHDPNGNCNGTLEPLPKKKKKKTQKTKLWTPDSFINGLIVEELAEGETDGNTAAEGNMVEVHINAKLKENGHIIESSVGRSPCLVHLGDDSMIRGFTMGVVGMRVGEKRRLTIPPYLGFGEEGLIEDNIPPNAWLQYDVELVDVLKTKHK